jgi:hypothetical protein
LDRRLGGSRIGLDDVKRRKIFPYRNSNFDPSAVEAVAIRCTDYSILAL